MVYTALHFDSGRNTIVLMRGRRRYLLADPTQCQNFNLYQQDHPSSRHTSLPWTDMIRPEYNLWMNEVVLQPGDALILPSYWFHSIIGLTNQDAQCNAWSVGTLTWKKPIQDCGVF